MIGTVLLFIIIFWYLITRFKKLEIIKKMSKKQILRLILMAFLLLITLFYFGKMIVIIYIIHLVLFFVLGDIFYFILRKILKRNIKYNIIGLGVLVITSFYIGYTYHNAQNIKMTEYMIESEKVDNEIKIVQIADVHLGTTFNGTDFNKYLDEISLLYPDILVLTGDFVDESTSYEDMLIACEGLGRIKTKYGVYTIFGNHDLNTYGGNRYYSIEQFITELKNNNVTILEDETLLINEEFYLIGRKDKTIRNRLGMFDLTKNIDKTKPMIVLDHQPVDFDNNEAAGIDLLLSGHTHGGQLFPLAYIGELISDNEMTYGIKKINNTTFIVSSGM